MSERLSQLLSRLLSAPAAGDELRPEELAWLSEATGDEVTQLLRFFISTEQARSSEADVSSVLRHLVSRVQPWRGTQRRRMSAAEIACVRELYSCFPARSMPRAYLLQWLAASGGAEELALFCEFVVSQPPPDASAAMLALGPLFQNLNYDPSQLFPRLLDAIAQPSVAVPIIDLANYLTRSGRVDRHPAAGRTAELMNLLGAVAQRLSQIEEQPPPEDSLRTQLAEQIEESVALAVALCDALALIGDRAAIGKLYQAFEVHHRRLHIEAAAALARLGEEPGKESLVALAADPVTRLRALAYAEELGLADRIADEFRTPVAQAEAELTLWLAQPAQMGIPPTRCELVDSRRLAWPGFDEPVECFLFRFDYQLGQRRYSNIGIVGPLVHAFAADLLDLSPADIYAAFAGWHAQHEEIYERDAGELTEPQRVEVARLERRLRDEGFDAIQPVLWGMFLGDRVLVARAVRSGVAGVAVVDLQDSLWFPARHPDRPIGPADALCIYRGRRLLRSFNEEPL